MATCGYICPQCNGTELKDNGDICDWCSVDMVIKDEPKVIISDDEWMKNVHEGKCCAD